MAATTGSPPALISSSIDAAFSCPAGIQYQAPAALGGSLGGETLNLPFTGRTVFLRRDQCHLTQWEGGKPKHVSSELIKNLLQIPDRDIYGKFRDGGINAAFLVHKDPQTKTGRLYLFRHDRIEDKETQLVIWHDYDEGSDTWHGERSWKKHFTYAKFPDEEDIVGGLPYMADGDQWVYLISSKGHCQRYNLTQPDKSDKNVKEIKNVWTGLPQDFVSKFLTKGFAFTTPDQKTAYLLGAHDQQQVGPLMMTQVAAVTGPPLGGPTTSVGVINHQTWPDFVPPRSSLTLRPDLKATELRHWSTPPAMIECVRLDLRGGAGTTKDKKIPGGAGGRVTGDHHLEAGGLYYAIGTSPTGEFIQGRCEWPDGHGGSPGGGALTGVWLSPQDKPIAVAAGGGGGPSVGTSGGGAGGTVTQKGVEAPGEDGKKPSGHNVTGSPGRGGNTTTAEGGHGGAYPGGGSVNPSEGGKRGEDAPVPKTGVWSGGGGGGGTWDKAAGRNGLGTPGGYRMGGGGGGWPINDHHYGGGGAGWCGGGGAGLDAGGGGGSSYADLDVVYTPPALNNPDPDGELTISW
jgi:hypothetical protein